ncbi:hypothetical protein TRICHSKD4_4518 [Roseibium sp. TrichSKD4]|nr:hypothetical protein TRICHSKD4_4518 [Roseibium sp. TrichSKD4]
MLNMRALKHFANKILNAKAMIGQLLSRCKPPMMFYSKKT